MMPNQYLGLHSPAKAFCALIIAVFTCCASLTAQVTVADYLEFGDVIYDPADSTQHAPVTIQDLVPDFPEHDSAYFKGVCLNSGKERASDCISEWHSDKLGRCFKLYMQYPKYRSAFAILNCYYYNHGEKSDMPDLYLIMDDKLRLRVWKKH
jgi:hypothetical protein